jgi:hypothetical protein
MSERQPFGVPVVLPYDVPPDRRPDRATAIAYTLGHLRRDQAAVDVIVDTVEPHFLAVQVAMLAIELGARSTASDAELDGLLSAWLGDDEPV